MRRSSGRDQFFTLSGETSFHPLGSNTSPARAKGTASWWIDHFPRIALFIINMRTSGADGSINILLAQSSELSDPIELLLKVVVQMLAFELESVTETPVLA